MKKEETIGRHVKDLFEAHPAEFRGFATLFEVLREQQFLSVEAHAEPIGSTKKECPSIRVAMGEDPTVLLALSVHGRHFWFQFSTKTDLLNFMASCELKESKTGKQLADDPARYLIRLETALSVEVGHFDAEAVATALADQLPRSPMTKVIPRDDDTELKRQLRRFHSPLDEIEFDYVLEDVLSHLSEENADAIFDALGDYDPKAEEDPLSVPGTELILLSELAMEQDRMLDVCARRLRVLCRTFEELGTDAKAELAEANSVLEAVRSKLHPKTRL